MPSSRTRNRTHVEEDRGMERAGAGDHINVLAKARQLVFDPPGACS